MLSTEDIQKIIKAQKEIFVTKSEFESFREDLRKDFSNLQSAVDAYSVKADKYFQEMVMLARKVDRHEKWLLQIAEKLNIKLEY